MYFSAVLILFGKIILLEPLWWSTGQCARLPFRQSKFESRRNLKFCPFNLCLKRTKIKNSPGLTHLKIIIKTTCKVKLVHSNSDRQSTRQASWPIDHHGPNKKQKTASKVASFNYCYQYIPLRRAIIPIVQPEQRKDTNLGHLDVRLNMITTTTNYVDESVWFKCTFWNIGAWIAEWYHTWLWTLVCCAIPWAVSLSLDDDKLFFGPKHNIYTFFMIIFGLFELIPLFFCQTCHVNCETENLEH